MAKARASKGGSGVTNKALHSRVSYLYQAAAYLVTREPHHFEKQSKVAFTAIHQADEMLPNITPSDDFKLPAQGLSRRFISDLRSVSLKSQIRLSPAMKHTICKRCDIMLIDGLSCESGIENKSKGCRKPWADILVRKCKSCDYERRFPVESKRQTRRPFRAANAADKTPADS